MIILPPLPPEPCPIMPAVICPPVMVILPALPPLPPPVVPLPILAEVSP